MNSIIINVAVIAVIGLLATVALQGAQPGVTPGATPKSTGQAIAGRYDVSADGATVRDLTTGLTWQRVCPQTSVSMVGAEAYCAGLNLGGTGWHLPTRAQLLGIVDVAYRPSIHPLAFPGAPDWVFWTGSSASTPSTGFAISFADGRLSEVDRGELHNVRCVK